MEDGVGSVSLSVVCACVCVLSCACSCVCTGTFLNKCRISAHINLRERYTVVSEWA